MFAIYSMRLLNDLFSCQGDDQIHQDLLIAFSISSFPFIITDLSITQRFQYRTPCLRGPT